MKALVTGSAGHLGEALVRTLRGMRRETMGLDVNESPFTSRVGSITDRAFVRRCMAGVRWVFHAATLHKPHLVTHSAEAFVDTNVTGALILIEEAARAGVESFVFTSTTSVFGEALSPPAGAPAAWITEDVACVPKNIYGVTKLAAENLCRLIHKSRGLSCVVLRTSRFFPEEDDDTDVRAAYADDNVKANEFLFRRVDIEDAVSAHLLAAARAPALGFAAYVVSATTPLRKADLAELARDAPAVAWRRAPGAQAEYARRGWSMFPAIGRVYVNRRARQELGWRPRHDFDTVIASLSAGADPRSALARAIGLRGYHGLGSSGRPYPVAESAAASVAPRP